MAALSRTTCFLVVWMIFLTVHLCMCCMEGDGYFGWQCDNVTGCFCKQGQRCQRTLRTCPEHCVDNPWGIGCHDENINLAYRKQATQSSTYINSSNGMSYPAYLAVDGDNSTDDMKCIRTNYSYDPSWSVDLGGLFVVRRVILIKPTTLADICQFQGVRLCINNNTASGTGCRDVSVPHTQCSTAVLEYEIVPPILARYVNLRKIHGGHILRLCEMIVRGFTYPYNVALGKTANQTSVVYGGVASRAIDGNVNAIFYAGSCTHTDNRQYPWWRVDLGQQYVVYSVTLFNRDDGDDSGKHLRNIQVSVRNSTDANRDVCATHVLQVPRGGTAELSCQVPYIAQVVIVLLEYTAPLILCEVIVKGFKYEKCTNKNLGPECRNRCNCRDTNEQCHPVYGVCTSGCAEGWQGKNGTCQVDTSLQPYLTTAPGMSSRTQDSLTISWRKWSSQTGSGVGSVHSYVVRVWRQGGQLSNVTVSSENHIATIGNLFHYTDYNISVTIRNNAGYHGVPSPTTTARTCGEPVAPPHPNVNSFVTLSKRSTFIEIKTTGMNQEVHRCDGFAKLTVRYEEESNHSGTVDVLHVNETQLITITNLTTYSKYTIYMAAINNLQLKGPPVTVIHTTAEGIPPKMAAPEVTSTGDSFIEITWRAPSPPGGVIVSYEISYTQESSLWNETVTEADSSSIIIGELQFNSTYVIRIRAKTAVGYGEYSDAIQATTDTEKATPVPATDINGGAVAGGVFGVLVLVAVVVVVVVVYKRSRRPQEPDQVETFSELQRKEDLDDHVYESPVQVPYENMEAEHLYSSIKQNTETLVDNIYEAMKLKTRDALYDEFQKFPLTLKYPCEVGQKRENKLKNRSRNTIPYDHNRVVLDLLPDDPHSDYINANFIDGYNRPRAFIAAQSPKSNTVNDFWRMIWQFKSPQIVMLTKTVEMDKQKCEQYWADKGVKQFGEIQVTTLDEVQGQDFFVRNLQYCKVGHPTVQPVKQFHFTGWPDNGVPIEPTALVKFREEVEKHDILVEGQGPVVVHCSDGVGNTGTFIALDYLFEQALAEGKVDVFRVVLSLRASRPKMVQTKEQYYFIHDTLLEELHCGNTFIRLQELAARLRKLRQRNKTGLTRMEEEFAVLGLMLPEIEESSTKTAHEPINIGKNRVINIVAGNHCRPRLTSYAEDSTDYINAVFIDGYQRQNAYIITQMPLPHTIVDFWSMLYDQQCATIVMLNELNDDSKTSGVYWPTEKVTSYGPFNVELISTRQSGKRITVRELRVTNSKDHSGAKRKVCQFQFQDWMASKPVPPSPRAFLELFDAVQQWHQKCGDTPITVHCMNGAHQSGLFCAVARILDKLKVEQEVDVFHTVKAVRQNRPQLIDSKEQYVFCYDVVEEYVRKFDTYVNLQM